MISSFSSMNSKPLLLITLGDPNGVGPEIVVKALNNSAISSLAQYAIVGDPKVVDHARERYAPELRIESIESLSQISTLHRGVVPLWSGGVSFQEELRPGEVRSEAGRAAIGWVKAAVEAIQRGEAAAMVTAPLCKEAVEPSVPRFSGHTEFIGELCGDPEPVLALFHGNWRVAHVSTHVSLREACERVKTPRLLKTTRALHAALKRVGCAAPRIGVAGLNPHAGENGLFGREEIKVIAPAVELLKAEGLDVTGPLPADVVFPLMKAGRFDGVIAMYHDQGHVVTKTIGFELGEKRLLHGVNATLGLPIVRTSVDHGTGFDIAWQEKADEHSLLDAIELAADLAR